MLETHKSKKSSNYRSLKKINRFISVINKKEGASCITTHLLEAGMSLKKTPAEKVKTKHQIPPEKWEVIYGGYKSNLRLCFLPLDENTKCGYWFGFETEIQRTFPVFKAKTDI